MPVSVTQRNATRNQSTADYEVKRIFVFDNRFVEANFKNNSGANLDLQAGLLVCRDTGTYETASVAFSATPLSAGQTVILGGLTYTSTAATTQAQLAAAFANLEVGATTGAGTATGTYSGALAGWATGPVVGGNTVVFTSTTTGNVTNLAQTGTGASSVITTVPGSTAVANGVVAATSGNLANLVGVSAYPGITTLTPDDVVLINYGTKGTIDPNYLVFPAGVTLDTLVSGRNVRDLLENIGLHLEPGVENTKFDN